MSTEEKISFENVKLVLFAVRNKEGKWFRAKGQNGYGNSWVDEIKDAKIYTKIAQARSRVTFWANNYPDFGIPDLVKIISTKFEVIEETSRVKNAKEKKDREEAQRLANNKKWELERAQKDFNEAQRRLKSLKK